MRKRQLARARKVQRRPWHGGTQDMSWAEWLEFLKAHPEQPEAAMRGYVQPEPSWRTPPAPTAERAKPGKRKRPQPLSGDEYKKHGRPHLTLGEDAILVSKALEREVSRFQVRNARARSK